MPLLGWPLLVTLGVAALAVLVVTLWAWPALGRRHSGRVAGRAGRVAGRAGLVLLNQAMAVLLVAAALNNYGYFFGSWSDLLGGPPAPTQVRHVVAVGPSVHHLAAAAGSALGPAGAGPGVAGGGPAEGGLAAVAPSQASVLRWSTPAQYPTRGRVAALDVSGPRSRLDAQALVYLPPQYFQPRYAHTRFPAAEVLTGYPGLTRSLVDRLHYPDVLLHELRAGRAQPMVLVMLRPTVAPPRDTECTDVPGGPLALTFLAEDVPGAVEQALRVRATGWGAMGESTGGYCAAKLALTHSDVFTAGVALSGYFHTLHDRTTGDLWGGSAVLRRLNDPEWLVAHQPPPPVSLLLTVSRQEHGPTGLVDTRRFLSLARPPLRVDAIIEPRGGHTFATWSRVMPPALDWLSGHLDRQAGA